MQELLFLAHRIPYPPDKGDKIRSWHFLEHLARRYRVHLGCFVDDPRDWQFEGVLRSLCEDCCLVGLDPARARRHSLRGLFGRQPLTLPYYYNRRLARWVAEVLRRPAVERAFVYCSAMAQYLPADLPRPLRRVADFVDVDSEKWEDYAQRMTGAKAWVYRREGRALRRVEQQVAAAFDRTLLATALEADLLRRIAPAGADRIEAVPNGIDGDYFSPERHYDNPYPPERVPLVFTGAMDYWPNADAVQHFRQAILPAVRARLPDASFVIVGSNPTAEVAALAAAPEVIVTGRVPDVRPYTAHARVVVAPLRVGRGVQNKVLEGMAMARPVVASPEALAGIEAEVGRELLLGADPAAFAAAVCAAADPARGAELGQNGRRRVLADYAWSGSLARLDAIMAG